jgi:hypothetical protein
MNLFCDGVRDLPAFSGYFDVLVSGSSTASIGAVVMEQGFAQVLYG